MSSPPSFIQRRVIPAPPILKIGAWLGATYIVLAAVQLAAAALGAAPHDASKLARALLLPVSLAGFAFLGTIEQRPARDYGLAVPRRWGLSLGWGLFAGAALGGAGYALCIGAGAMQINPSVGAARWLHVVWIVPIALLFALAANVVYSGYVVTAFAERHGRFLGVAAAAILLPVYYRIDDPIYWTEMDHLTNFAGLLCAQLLLGALRVRTGHVLFGSALLAGMIVARNVSRRVLDLTPLPDSYWAVWLCPGGDPRRAPAYIFALAFASAIVGWRAHRSPPPPTIEDADVSASLRRINPLATPLILASFGALWAGLCRARWRVPPEYWPRLAAMLWFSATNAILSLPERLVAPWLCRRRVPDPVFIIGVHRSGTTHLHNLLSLDSQFVAPRNCHVLNPSCALAAGLPLSPLLAAFFPWRRPMDAMPTHIFSANEEEFAIANQCTLSPYWGWVFPRSAERQNRFLHADQFTEKEKQTWSDANRRFLRRLVFWNGRRPVLKNPCNTGRVAMLVDMFPDARIIHIHRHPYDVYRSNAHFARQGHAIFHLQNAPAGGGYMDHFLEHYERMERAYDEAASRLRPDRVVDVRFEDLEADPMGVIEDIYRRLGLPLGDAFRRRLRSYLARVSAYRKNVHRELPENDRARVDRAMAAHMKKWGYDAPDVAAG